MREPSPTSIDIRLERSAHPHHGGHENAHAHRGLLSSNITPEPSGTSWEPESTPMEGLHYYKKKWLFMLHGFANAGYTARLNKSESLRGADQFFTTNMFMFMGLRELKSGAWGFRVMADLEPVMGPDGYPLLMQTGGVGEDQTHLVDRQHPHDMIMELAATYSHSLSKDQTVFVYAGLPGEPAFGPPAFMHRFSSINNPTAPITHHWFESTHITEGVATLGYVWKNFKLDGSVFNGKEPDDRRWDIERPEFNSYSARAAINASENLAFQASYGRIGSPHSLLSNLDYSDRVNATAMMNWMPPQEVWQFLVGWGATMDHPGNALGALLVELTRAIRNTHFVFYRLEVASKNDLFLSGGPSHFHRPDLVALSPDAGETKLISRVSAGYLYDFKTYRKTSWGVGAQISVYPVPRALEVAYGSPGLNLVLFTRMRFSGLENAKKPEGFR